MFGINVSNLNFRIKIDPVKQPIQSNSVGSWHMSQCGTSTFYYHFNHGIIVTKDIQHSIGTRMCSVWWNEIGVDQIEIGVRWNLFSHVGWVFADSFLRGSLTSWGLLVWFGAEWNTSITESQRSRAGIPSMRKPALRGTISASVELCETEVCFLHIQLFGTNVWLPNMHKSPPEVDLESSRSPAKSESWKSSSLQCCAVFPTWQYCLNSLVWWMWEIKRA